jgi:hypothetical protein
MTSIYSIEIKDINNQIPIIEKGLFEVDNNTNLVTSFKLKNGIQILVPKIPGNYTNGVRQISVENTIINSGNIIKNSINNILITSNTFLYDNIFINGIGFSNNGIVISEVNDISPFIIDEENIVFRLLGTVNIYEKNGKSFMSGTYNTYNHITGINIIISTFNVNIEVNITIIFLQSTSITSIPSIPSIVKPSIIIFKSLKDLTSVNESSFAMDRQVYKRTLNIDTTLVNNNKQDTIQNNINKKKYGNSSVKDSTSVMLKRVRNAVGNSTVNASNLSFTEVKDINTTRDAISRVRNTRSNGIVKKNNNYTNASIFK